MAKIWHPCCREIYRDYEEGLVDFKDGELYYKCYNDKEETILEDCYNCGEEIFIEEASKSGNGFISLLNIIVQETEEDDE